MLQECRNITGDLMTQLGGSTVGWDENGNMASVSAPAARSFTYNWDNKLRSGQMGTSSVALKYDPMGNRVWKQSTVSGQTTTRKYIVDIAGGLPTILLEIDPTDSSLKKTYIYANGEILAQHDGGCTANRYFYLHDRLGSVREIIDSSGGVVNYYTFGPFGDTRESGGSLSNPFMFASQYYDFEIGQYYMRARQYDPQLMRFTGRDSTDGKFEEPMTLHKYLYCMNNSINKIDPSGKNPDDCDGGIFDGGASFEDMLNVYNNMNDLPIPVINTKYEIAKMIMEKVTAFLIPGYGDVITAYKVIRFWGKAQPYLERIGCMNALETGMIYELADEYGD